MPIQRNKPRPADIRTVWGEDADSTPAGARKSARQVSALAGELFAYDLAEQTRRQNRDAVRMNFAPVEGLKFGVTTTSVQTSLWDRLCCCFVSRQNRLAVFPQ